ncbi:E3 ubiquitin-protein ligase TRIM52-like [Heteronotia binoei]|uniref:E3 ubiquitin-protein ligase TRIM52-like n=1 Tax=Heteronotia binoei TaxID=13085 RepID=UPI00292CC435|nr:E3 ubiquitin-protein ligase TRIM52-like [Heteronotia binoei]
MATGRDPGAAVRDETTCSICLDHFQDPLMIVDCGHDFCRACITRYSGGGSDLSVLSCPECRKPFSWGDLRANRRLGNVAELIQQFPLERLSEAEGAQKVCREHKEAFQFFCREDRAFICSICKDSEAHKTHVALPIDQAVQNYQDQIQNYVTLLKKEKDEILKKINNEKAIKEVIRSIIYIREQKEHGFPKEEVHTLLALLRDVEEKTVQMADENASDTLEHSAHLTELIREMGAKCLQPAFEFLQMRERNG